MPRFIYVLFLLFLFMFGYEKGKDFDNIHCAIWTLVFAVMYQGSKLNETLKNNKRE